VRKIDTGEVFAMKIMKKEAMVVKNQVRKHSQTQARFQPATDVITTLNCSSSRYLTYALSEMRWPVHWTSM
jgi:hypothetical protein